MDFATNVATQQLKANLERIQSQAAELQQQIDQNKDTIVALKSVCEEKEARSHELAETVEELTDSLQSASLSSQSLKSAVARRGKEVRWLRLTLAECRDELEHLKVIMSSGNADDSPHADDDEFGEGERTESCEVAELKLQLMELEELLAQKVQIGRAHV